MRLLRWVRQQRAKWQLAGHRDRLDDPQLFFQRSVAQQLLLGRHRLVISDCEANVVDRPHAKGYSRIHCDSAQDLIDQLRRLSCRQNEIYLASKRLLDLVRDSHDALRALSVACAGRVWFSKQFLEDDQSQFRMALHRAGFYEVVDCTIKRNDDQPALSFDCSSVGIHPDGTLQLEGSQPGMASSVEPCWLVASRLPLRPTRTTDWVGVFGVGRQHLDGYVSSFEAGEPTLWVRKPEAQNNLCARQRISGTFRWQSPVSAHESGSLVGCYHGPGDSNMYLAMVTPLPNLYVELALWRGSGGWDRVAHCILPEDQCAVELINDPSLCNRQVDVSLEITRDRVRLLRGGDQILEMEDQTIARNLDFGVRMHSSVLQVGRLEHCSE